MKSVKNLNDWNRNLGEFWKLGKFDENFIDIKISRKSIDLLTRGNCPSVPSAHCTKKRDERRRAKKWLIKDKKKKKK